ncbi:MAG: bile acid:sodium symporter family protein, partial [Verrucomicrobiia bacterium]
AQFLIMPLLGWSIATLMNLPREFAIGLILVSCCPGGTASNVVAYIARAHLPLSLLMTMCSTLAAIVLTPLLSKFYLSEIIQVDAVGLFM